MIIDGTIDKSIVCHINRLNEMGYKTEYCCSGLDRDHTFKNPTSGAYISFVANLDPKLEQDIFRCSIDLGLEFRRKKQIFGDFGVAIYFNIYGGGQDEKILLMWDKVIEYLQKCQFLRNTDF